MKQELTETNPKLVLQRRIVELEHVIQEQAARLTECKNAQEQLRASVERIVLAVESSEVGLWEQDLQRNTVWYSREWKRQLGYEEDEISDSLDEWEKRVHPEDLSPTTEKIAAYLARPVGVHEIEFRMQHRDGSWRWMLARGQLRFDHAGNACKFCGGHFDITGRRAVREQVQLERDLFEQIVNSLPGVFYLFDRDGRFHRWNRNFERLTGYSPAELANLSAFDLFQGSSRDLVERRVQETFATGESFAEAELMSKDGTPHPYFFTGRRIEFNGEECLIGMGIDISERIRVEQALQRSEQRYAMLVNDIDGILWEADAAREQFTFVSDFAQKLLGYPLSAWYEPHFWSKHLHPHDRASTQTLCAEHAQHGENHEIEYRMMASDGRVLWLRDLVSVEGAASNARSMRGVMIDVTARKQAASARVELEGQMRQSQKLEALGTLAGGIAHDFNNLLLTILGNATLLQEDTANSQASQCVDEILRAGQRAKELVRQILTFSRPSEQRLEVLDLVAVVDEAIRLLRSTLPAGIELQFSTSGLQTLNLKADASQLHQVVLNLATNAWHAMEGKKGRIEARLERMFVDTAQVPELPRGEYACLSVRDEGTGIDNTTLPRIFEPFFTTKPPGVGTGLGLSVVHGIVRNHGGTIRVSSQLGMGTIVRVYLPASAEVAKPADEHHSKPRQGQGEHILYIDDEEPLVFLTKRFLERHGFRVTGHTSATEALSEFRRNPTAFDLIVTDSNMPGMSGLDVAQEVLDVDPHAKIVLTSGYLRQEEVERGRELGIVDVILKPNTLEELGPLMERILRPSKPS